MYANVIVDISHEKLDKTFQYLVPAGLENEIEPGVCVEIPFGNRKITGYVVEITENPEFDVDKIKPLCNIVKGSVAVGSVSCRTCVMDQKELWRNNESGVKDRHTC